VPESAAKSPPLHPKVREVEQQMRDLMHEPLLVRKKTFRDLALEYHPDKNGEAHATEVFQAVNDAKDWFLRDS